MSKQIGRNEPCWCGSGRKYKVCHAGFDAKIESYREQGHIVPPHHIIKTPAQIEQIKENLKSCDLPEAKGLIYKIEEISQILSPVFDSYKNRDFKQADEDLIWASLDLLG